MEGLGSILSQLPQGNYLKRRCPFYDIVCKNDLPDKKPDVNFLDDYIMNAPLTGKAFTIDASEVHTSIVNFITKKQQI